MKPNHSNSAFIQTYHLCFVIVWTVVLLLVMFMSSQPGGFGKLEESFFQRPLLIGSFNRLRIKLGDRVFTTALIGKDGWMEYTGGGNLDDYQNAVNFSPETLQAAAQAIRNCSRYAQEHKITFLVVVAPNKASIYPDKLPDQIQPLSSLSRLDQLNNYLRTHRIPEVLDLRPALLDARRQQDTYYKMGTHWNEYGAYVAYEAIIHALSQDYPELEAYPPKFFRFRDNPKNAIYRGDMGIAGMLQAKHLSLEPAFFSTRNMDDVYHKIDFPVPNTIHSYHTISWIPDSGLPSLLIYHDSFGEKTLNDFLALNFSKGFYIHLNASHVFLNKQAIEQFSPNIVIFQVVERNLNQIQNHLAGCAGK